MLWARVVLQASLYTGYRDAYIFSESIGKLVRVSYPSKYFKGRSASPTMEMIDVEGTKLKYNLLRFLLAELTQPLMR